MSEALRTSSPQGSTDDRFSALIEAIPEDVLEVMGASSMDFDSLPLSREPHKNFSRLRDELGGIAEVVDGKLGSFDLPTPHGWDPEVRQFVVMGYDAAREYAEKPADILTIETGKVALRKIYGRVLGLTEGPDHIRVRRAMDKNALGRGQVEERAEAMMRPAAEYLVKRAAAKIARGEPVELRRDLVMPMVFKPMSALIGVPEERFDEFMPLCHRAFMINDVESAKDAAEDIKDFLYEELNKRRGCPAEDVISRLLHNDNPKLALSDDEIIRNATFLLPAGLDTTRYTMVTVLTALLMHPEQYRQVVEDPGLVSKAIEEGMRWQSSPVLGGVREALKDTEIAGLEIPAGSFLTICAPATNRDPKYWSDPEVFNIHRTEKTPHMTFFTGRHYCIGQNLARKEMNILLETMVKHLPNLRSAIPIEDIKVQGMFMSGPTGGVPLTA